MNRRAFLSTVLIAPFLKKQRVYLDPVIIDLIGKHWVNMNAHWEHAMRHWLKLKEQLFLILTPAKESREEYLKALDHEKDAAKSVNAIGYLLKAIR